MTENDELTNIPPMIPDADEVDAYRSNKKSQSQDIVRPSYHNQKVKVSTWPVRFLLTLITLTLLAAGYGAYYAYEEIYLVNMRQAELRIGDLESRLAMAGDSAEESSLNMMDTMNFNFSEIDKLWAARRVINTSLETLQSELAKFAMALGKHIEQSGADAFNLDRSH